MNTFEHFRERFVVRQAEVCRHSDAQLEDNAQRVGIIIQIHISYPLDHLSPPAVATSLPLLAMTPIQTKNATPKMEWHSVKNLYS